MKALLVVVVLLTSSCARWRFYRDLDRSYERAMEWVEEERKKDEKNN